LRINNCFINKTLVNHNTCSASIYYVNF